ncbi:IS4 family transposase [Paenibacillus alba]|uniref:IS4 family transposase n=1 Tax=Paenibacillus alba TaxID=1197127 RepID=UPI001566E543|nr:IS4 family transposase [Paenibacillus alba]NQX64496.1 IS4 family transposase [Paenibacillus alba]
MDNIPTKTVMRQCLQWLNVHYGDLFRDYRCKLKTGQAILLFLEATLASRKTLEDIAEHLRVTEWFQDWLNLPSISGAALHRKLEDIPLELFQEIFQTLYQAIAFHYVKKPGLDSVGHLAIIDSSEIRLPPIYGKWAYVSETQNAVKMHTMLVAASHDSVCPGKVVLSTAAVSDQEVATKLMAELNYTYVFDRGYIHYASYQQWALTGIRFVARIKANSKCKIVETRSVTGQSSVILDADVDIVEPKIKEVFRLRLVEYTFVDRKKKLVRIRVLTNRWDLSAEEISNIYKYRWKIELFFRSMKGNMNLKKLYNTKPSAVWNQIYLSLIAYAMVELIRLSTETGETCLFLLRKLLSHADKLLINWKDALVVVKTKTSTGRKRKKKRGRPRKHPEVFKAVHWIIE